MTELTVGTKFDQGKLRWDLVPPEFEEVVKVLTFGANKYEDRNWEKGINYGRLIAACLRHLFSWIRGERLDPETGLHHLAHLGCDVLFLLTYEQRGMNDFNDLPAYRRRDVESKEVAGPSGSRVSVLTPPDQASGRSVGGVTPPYWPSSGSDLQQAEQPSLDPLYVCGYNGA